ncbi:MAG: NADH-quinone oxidoreductase subunit A [FCB group bacterium]|jgi:NADH-quinone oxidoreductase subunit A|nr:NADH-quinone oxidoreductase subunit A [FCB group bacterium]
MTEPSTVYWPLGLYFASVVVVIGVMVGASYLLGQRHRDRATGSPYESGITSTGTARVRFSADFFLVAIFFVIFDLESVFVFAWAIAAKELGWVGYAQIFVFIAVLAASLVYLWREGALES